MDCTVEVYMSEESEEDYHLVALIGRTSLYSLNAIKQKRILIMLHRDISVLYHARIARLLTQHVDKRGYFRA